jgi:hypothetical protein
LDGRIGEYGADIGGHILRTHVALVGRVISTFLGAVGLTGTLAAAQEPDRRVSVRSTPECHECAVELTKVVSLGLPSDSVLLHPSIGAPVRDSRNRYFAIAFDRASIAIYDSMGKLVRTVGRRGAGPGEFTNIRELVIGPGDTLFVRHSTLAVSVLSPSSLSEIRRFNLPPAQFHALTPLADGTMLVAVAFSEANMIGPLFHRLAASGDPVSTFGRGPREDAGCVPCLALQPVLSSEKGFWTIRPRDYVLEEWSVESLYRSRLSMSGSTWFDPAAARKPATRIGVDRPAPRLGGLGVMSGGRLAVFGYTAARTWKPDPTIESQVGTPTRIGGQAVRLQPIDKPLATAAADYIARQHDTVVDVIDPIRGTLLTSRRFSQIALHSLGTNLAYSSRVDADGVRSLDIWRIDLRQP